MASTDLDTGFETGAAACPGCSMASVAAQRARQQAGAEDETILVSLPTIHCAACINTVEQGLLALPHVKDARVNLTRKRATVHAAAGTDPADVAADVERLGYEAHVLDSATLSGDAADRAGRDLLMRLAVAGFASMNVMLLSVAVWSGAEGATRDLFHWISAAIVMPAVAFSAQPFFRNAWTALRARHLNMDVPISLAILLALVTSLWETSLSGEHAYFDAAIALTFFLLTGRYLDHRTRSVARSAARELAALEVPKAWRIGPEGDEKVDAATLAVGDLVRVHPGARMPVDGDITEGTSELDRSLLTGETVPVHAEPGRAVSAGEVNLTGPLVIRATAVGRDTSLHRMADLVAVAESGRSRYTSLADKAAKLYAPGVHVLSALAFLGWLAYTGDLRVALNIAAAVLIITCPCALGLAVPAVTTAASGRLFRHGLLIKNATALERLAQVDTVVFDKTGTLTAGTPVPTNLAALPPRDLQIALALAEGSAHPLSKALTQAARAAGVVPAEVTDINEVPGHGTHGTWQGHPVRLGRAAWLGAEPLDQTAAWLRVGDEAPQPFLFTDRLRDGAAETVAALQAKRAARDPDVGRQSHGGSVAGRCPGDRRLDRRGTACRQGRPYRDAERRGRQGSDGGRRAERHRGADGRPCVDLSGLGAGRGARGLGHRAAGFDLVPPARGHLDRRAQPAPHPRELHGGHLVQYHRGAAGGRGPVFAPDRGAGHVGQLDHRFPECPAREVGMEVLSFLIPISIFLGIIGLAGFIWTLRTNQYDDPEGDARRILSDTYDDHPAED